jgi:aminoglycoside 3-N-acetyltransferase
VNAALGYHRPDPELPATVGSIARDLAALGVRPGMTLLVHSSLRSLGYVCGGAVAVIAALERALGDDGTMVVPTHTSTLSEPSLWMNPPVPPAWFPIIRNETPPFDPELTPAVHMGIIPETYRRRSGVVRSAHPMVSFAAGGRLRHRIIDDHPLEFGLGESSPLGRLFELDAHVLLLGVDHDRNTSMHLAEHRAAWEGKEELMQGSPIVVDGERVWAKYRDLDYDSTDFLRIGACFEDDTDHVTIGDVAQSTARLMRIRPLVRYATEWMQRMRPTSLLPT